LFTATAHSPIGLNPEEFEIEITGPIFEGFAQNDLIHLDKKGADHEKFTNGLNAALNSYLNKTGFDKQLSSWFDFPVVATSHPVDLIEAFLEQ
jgi:hypothetical protein